MRVSAVEVVPYALPFREPYVTARGALTQRELVLLRLRTEEGAIGLGEAVPLSLRGGAALSRVVAELQGLAELDAPSATSLREAATAYSAPARCAVETALFDLEAPASSERGVRCNATLVAGEPTAVAEDARRWVDAGFETFKLKLGSGDDYGQVEAVREAVGPEAKIRVDANATWSLEEAKRLLVGIEPFGIELAEQPVATLEEMGEVAAATSIPLAADESITDRAEAERAVELGACAYTGIKLSKVGGREAAIEIASLLPAYLSSALDGPVGIAAAAHVALTLDKEGGPALAHGLATQRLFASTVAAIECELRGDTLHLPPGPGLGVEIDEDALAAHRI